MLAWLGKNLKQIIFTAIIITAIIAVGTQIAETIPYAEITDGIIWMFKTVKSVAWLGNIDYLIKLVGIGFGIKISEWILMKLFIVTKNLGHNSHND